MSDPAKEAEQKHSTSANSYPPESRAVSEEPFACPHCGQMLAATCRVCVSCKKIIELAAIRRPAPTPAVARVEPPAVARPISRFSWQIFFLVFAASLAVATIALGLLGPEKAQVLVGILQILSSAWVFFDARQKHLPKPLRWGAGSLLLWIVFFPWYLSRRKRPEALCPAVEAESGPFVRVLLLVLLLFFMLGLILALLKGPLPR